MSGTELGPPLAGYRDEITELVAGGASFGDVEDAIDEIARLTQDQKAALWLFAFSLRDPNEQQLDSRAYLALVQ
jgi:hypothetical protein